MSDRRQLDMFGDGSPSPAGRPPESREDRSPSEARPVHEPTENSSVTDRDLRDATFAIFVAANPHVLPEMLKLACSKLTAGYKRIGAKALWEELRAHLRVNKLGAWKLNNSYTALAARKLIEMEPALAGVIEIRNRKAK